MAGCNQHKHRIDARYISFPSISVRYKYAAQYLRRRTSFYLNLYLLANRYQVTSNSIKLRSTVPQIYGTEGEEEEEQQQKTINSSAHFDHTAHGKWNNFFRCLFLFNCVRFFGSFKNVFVMCVCLPIDNFHSAAQAMSCAYQTELTSCKFE